MNQLSAVQIIQRLQALHQQADLHFEGLILCGIQQALGIFQQRHGEERLSVSQKTIIQHLNDMRVTQ